MTRKAIALFDFDGTLSKGDSIIPFLKYCVKTGFAPWYVLPKGAALGAMYLTRLVKSDTWAKERALSFLKGKGYWETQQVAEGFYREVLSRRIYPKGLEEIRRLREKGYVILIVSASPDVYMEPVRRALEAEAVLATRCGLDAMHLYTGGFASLNCRGFEKTLRIAEYLAAKGYELDVDLSRAYGDSAGDWPMMCLTANPVAVNAKKSLLKKAPQIERAHWA